MGASVGRAHRTPNRFTALVTVAAFVGTLWVGGTPTAMAAPPIAAVPLGAAASFGVLTSAAVGNTASGPVTIVRGDLGAGGGQTGFPPGLVT
ncbi:MAG: hypothetical protein ABIO83_04505, partial [Ilumatobacteraceae bacterium]